MKKFCEIQLYAKVKLNFQCVFHSFSAFLSLFLHFPSKNKTRSNDELNRMKRSEKEETLSWKRDSRAFQLNSEIYVILSFLESATFSFWSRKNGTLKQGKGFEKSRKKMGNVSPRSRDLDIPRLKDKNWREDEKY